MPNPYTPLRHQSLANEMVLMHQCMNGCGGVDIGQGAAAIASVAPATARQPPLPHTQHPAPQVLTIPPFNTSANPWPLTLKQSRVPPFFSFYTHACLWAAMMSTCSYASTKPPQRKSSQNCGRKQAWCGVPLLRDTCAAANGWGGRCCRQKASTQLKPPPPPLPPPQTQQLTPLSAAACRLP